MDIKEAVDKLPALIKERGGKYAEKQAEYENLKDLKDVLLAKIANDIEAKSEAERERRAKTSEAYENHLEGLRIAREESLKAKALLHAAEVKYELIRSLNSREVALSKIL